MTYRISLALTALLLISLLAGAAQKPNFTGAWVMDRDRSFGMPGNMQQTMTVNHTGDQIELETKLIQPDNERTVKDSYLLDGKERELMTRTARNRFAHFTNDEVNALYTYLAGKSPTTD